MVSTFLYAILSQKKFYIEWEGNYPGCYASYNDLFEIPKINNSILNLFTKKKNIKIHLEFTTLLYPKSYVLLLNYFRNI
jgi:hypothetical protein